MSTDISRVYLFLAQQGGIKAADSDNDGVIIKTEFVNFMEENFEWDGETTDAGKNDLINSFWKTIDTNRSGSISSTKLKNKNALDKKEIAAAEDKIAMYEILNEFMDKVDAPDEVSDQYAWKKSLADSLSNSVETWIKQGVKAEELEGKLNEELPLAKARTTADYVAKDYIEEVLSDVSNYARGDDKILKRIIDEYITKNFKNKTNSEELPSNSDIFNKIHELIDAYLATAKIGSGNTANLSAYGYSPKNNSPMNDLQKAVLMTEALESVASDADEKAKFDMSNDGYKSALQEYLNSLKYGDFEKLQGSVLENFKNSSFYATIQEKVDAANLEKARNEAISKCDAYYKKGTVYKNAVNEIFGENYAQSIKEMSVEDIEASLKQLEERVSTYDLTNMSFTEKEALVNSIFNSYTLSVGESKTVKFATTTSNNGKAITTDRITYVVNGKEQSSPNVVFDTSSPGTYAYSLAVKIDGQTVITKTVTVTVSSVSAANLFKNANLAKSDDEKLVNEKISRDWASDVKGCITTDTDKIKSVINEMAIALSNTPGVDMTALNTAKLKMEELYSMMINTLYSQCDSNTAKRGYNKNGCYKEETVQFNGVTYKAERDQDDDLHDIEGNVSKQNASKNQLGLYLQIQSHDDPRYILRINRNCMAKMFENFYKAALN